MAAAWAIGAGAGLASLAGFRAIIPLAVYIIMAHLGWVWGFSVDDNPMDFMISNSAVIVLLLLVVLEVLITRLPALAKIEQSIRMPLGLISGALVMTTAVAGELTGGVYLAGIVAGAALALVGNYVRGGLVMIGEGRDPGPALDVTVLLFSAVILPLPPAGYLIALVIFYLAFRVRRLRRLKYKGLRVLA